MEDSFKKLFGEVFEKLESGSVVVLISATSEQDAYMRSLVYQSEKGVSLYSFTTEQSYIGSDCSDLSVDFLFLGVKPTFFEMYDALLPWLSKLKKKSSIAGDGYETNADVKKIVNDMFPEFELKTPNHWFCEINK